MNKAALVGFQNFLLNDVINIVADIQVFVLAELRSLVVGSYFRYVRG